MMKPSNLDVGMKCIKYMLLIITFMFAVTSALIISVGTTIFAFYHDFSYFLEAHYYSPAALIVVVGVLMLFVSIFGCIGAFKESTCLVNIFALILSAALILELSAAIATYSLRRGVPEFVGANVRGALQLYADDREVKDAFDFVQCHLNCCGVDAWSDWQQLGSQLDGNGISVDNITLPYSCCARAEAAQVDGENIVACTELYASGCLPRLVYLVSQSAALLGTGATTIALVQMIGIVFSLMLAKSIRRVKSARELRRWQIREQMLNSQAYMTIGHEGKPMMYVPSEGHTTA